MAGAGLQSEVDDVVQDAIIKAWRLTTNIPDDWKAWLLAICRTTCLDAMANSAVRDALTGGPILSLE